ncbi:hypothetical protein MMC07_003623 [Pseudocyphellaria aurata]|nr:hypothetical protein [Pseudocyphellaria aurata]
MISPKSDMEGRSNIGVRDVTHFSFEWGGKTRELQKLKARIADFNKATTPTIGQISTNSVQSTQCRPWSFDNNDDDDNDEQITEAADSRLAPKPVVDETVEPNDTIGLEHGALMLMDDTLMQKLQSKWDVENQNDNGNVGIGTGVTDLLFNTKCQFPFEHTFDRHRDDTLAKSSHAVRPYSNMSSDSQQGKGDA